MLCPLLILYSLGYILKPGTEHGIAKTGLIYLSTLPSGATVYLEDKRFTEKTPVFLQGLLPGKYRVTVFLKGYRPWIHTISVRAEQAAVFDKILLVPKEWNCQYLAEEEFDNLIPLNDRRYLLLTNGPLLEDFYFYDFRKKILSPLTPDDFRFDDAHVVSYLTARRSEQLLIDAQLGLWGEEGFFWVDPSTKEKIKDITPFFADKPQFVDWDIRQPEKLFSFKNGTLSRVDLDSGEADPKFAESVRGYGLFGEKLYVLDQALGLQKMELDGKNREIISTHPFGPELTDTKDFLRIKVFPKNKIFFIGRRGELWSNEFPNPLVPGGVLDMQQDPTTQKILVYREDSLGILEPKSASIRWLVLKAAKITQAFWVYGGSHVLFRDGDKVALIELAEHTAMEAQEFLQVKRGSSILYVEKSGRLYYLEKKSGRFCAIDLMSHHDRTFRSEAEIP